MRLISLFLDSGAGTHRPAFLHVGALEVPATAVELVDKEQFRLYALTLRSIDTIREETRRADGDDEPAIHSAFIALRHEIGLFLRELIQRGGASAQNTSLFYATSLFERMIWLLRQLGLSLTSTK